MNPINRVVKEVLRIDRTFRQSLYSGMKERGVEFFYPDEKSVIVYKNYKICTTCKMHKAISLGYYFPSQVEQRQVMTTMESVISGCKRKGCITRVEFEE